jgi:hypothetical protein
MKNNIPFSEEKDLEKRPIPSRPKIRPQDGYYVTGFIDGEGSFYSLARKRPDYSTGWKFSAVFSVGNKDKSTIDLCQKIFGCGEIRKSTLEDFFILEITNRKLITQLILPFFEEYPFLTKKKQQEFELFKRLVTLIDKRIQTELDLEQFLSIRRQLDEYRQSRASNTDEIIRKTFKPQG